MRRPRPRTTFWSVLAVLAIGATAAAAGVQALALEPAPPPAPASLAPGETPAPTPTAAGPSLDRALNVLFMATDVNYEYRQGKRVPGLRGNTDTMMLARFDPGRGDARLLSIPRDTRTPIEGHGTFKINAANPYGGAKLATATVSALLGVPVDRYVLVNTRAVIQLVDAMGGVELDVPADLDYDDHAGGLHIHMKKGPNKLDGQGAHDFLRFRHDGQGDIGRVQRQQLFVQAAMRQLMTPANLFQVPKLIGLARENMETDLSMGELLRLTRWAKDLSGDRVQMAMVPGQEGIVRGGWYWIPDEEGIRRVVDGFLLDRPVPEARPAARLRVAVRDGVGDRAAARRLIRALAQAGYASVEDAGPDPLQDRVNTQIIAQNADGAAAEELAAAIGVGQVVVAATGVLGSEITVVMGRDWVARAKERAQAP